MIAQFLILTVPAMYNKVTRGTLLPPIFHNTRINLISYRKNLWFRSNDLLTMLHYKLLCSYGNCVSFDIISVINKSQYQFYDNSPITKFGIPCTSNYTSKNCIIFPSFPNHKYDSSTLKAIVFTISTFIVFLMFLFQYFGLLFREETSFKENIMKFMFVILFTHTYEEYDSTTQTLTINSQSDFDTTYRDEAKNLVIKDGITEIPDEAFKGFSILENINFGNTIKTIGTSSFEQCESLRDIVIPESVETINDGAFYDCLRLTSIIIPDSISSINSITFFFCTSLTYVTLGQKITYIGPSAFSLCSHLECFYFLGQNLPSIDSTAFEFAISSLTVMTFWFYTANYFGPYSVSKGDTVSGCNPLPTLTLTCSFTQSNTFSHTFTESNQFTNSNTFSQSNSFSQSNTLFGSNTYSQSNSSSQSNTYSQSNSFSFSFTFSQSNTYLQSNTFSQSYTFTFSNTFSQSNTFTQTNSFSKSDTLIETIGFTNGEYDTTITLSFTYSYSATETIISLCYLSNSFAISMINSSYTYINSEFIYYEYKVIAYSTNFAFYSYFVLYQNEQQKNDDNNKNLTFIIIGTCVPIVIIVIVIVIVLIVFRKKKNSSEVEEEMKNFDEASLNNFSTGVSLENLEEDPFAVDFKDKPFVNI